jgi:hypothetical protein
VASILRVEEQAKQETKVKQVAKIALLVSYFMLRMEATYSPETSADF